MQSLLILGAGQYGIVAKEIAEATNYFGKIAFLDDNNPIAIGKIADVDKFDYDATFVAIGNPDVRQAIVSKLRNLTTLIHPKATVMPSAQIGAGCIIETGAVICSNASVGSATIVMSNAVVGHNSKVGSCCQLKNNSTVEERAVVPDKTKIECNVVYKEQK